MRTLLLLSSLLLVACGPGGSVPADAGPGDGGVTDVGAPPATRDDMVAFLGAGSYLGWPAEAAEHASAGPHGGLVRTFVNPTLRTSLKAGNTTHPTGSAVVKELRSGGQVTGYAMDVKRADGTWVFFEGFQPALNQYFFVGTNNLCGTCHQAGTDYVWTAASAIP